MTEVAGEMVHIEMPRADAARLEALFDKNLELDAEIARKPWMREVLTILRRSYWRAVPPPRKASKEAERDDSTPAS
jgi:hypothetical protein